MLTTVEYLCLRFSRYADGEAEAVVVEKVEHLGCGAEGSQGTEHGQENVPDCQEVPQFVLRALVHHPLAHEDEGDVDTRPYNALPPVNSHPSRIVSHLELLLKVKGVTVGEISGGDITAALQPRREREVVDHCFVVLLQRVHRVFEEALFMKFLHGCQLSKTRYKVFPHAYNHLTPPPGSQSVLGSRHKALSYLQSCMEEEEEEGLASGRTVLAWYQPRG